MKKLILFLIVGVFLINFVWAECQVARPYYGSVNCKETGSWSEGISLGDEYSWTCEVSNCIIVGLDRNDFSCSGIGTTSILKVNVNGVEEISCSNTMTWGGDNLAQECNSYGLKNYELHKGDTIIPYFSCKFGEPEGDPKIIVKYKEIKLELNLDSGQNFQSGTEFCNSNPVWSNYQSKQLSNNEALKSIQISSNLDTSSDGLSNIPSDNIIGTLEPSQLNVGEGYWFVYDWVERPSLIVGNYNNQEVWCNPIDHSLIKLEEVNTRGDDCYLIPTSRLSVSVECCSTDECKGQYSNQAILCDDNFKCGFEKSCLSDYDCGGTSERCQEENGNYYLVKSSCDKSELDSYSKGSCKTEKKSVKCCSGDDGGPNVCGSGSYCDYELGCKEVTYKSSSGEIKTGIQGEAGITGAAIGAGGSKSKWIILIVIILVIAGGLGFYFFNKNKSHSSLPVESGKKCASCNSINDEDKKFCTNCGKKL